MGGTSTDVSHYAGEYERSFETVVAGVRMRAPMMKIHTVAAGGGSICCFDGARYRVGPESAGANPGPGLLSPRRPAHRHRLQRHARQAAAATSSRTCSARTATSRSTREVVARKFAELARRRSPRATGNRRTPVEVAEGFLAIAVENMANAIKQISIQRGYDVTDYTLCCFGGAGGQHACLVADALGHEARLHPSASPACCRPTAWAWPICARLREQAVEARLADERHAGAADASLDRAGRGRRGGDGRAGHRRGATSACCARRM